MHRTKVDNLVPLLSALDSKLTLYHQCFQLLSLCGAALNTQLDVVQTVGVKGKTLMAVGMESLVLCTVQEI